MSESKMSSYKGIDILGNPIFEPAEPVEVELIGPSGDGCHIAVNGEHYAYGNLEVNAWKAALRKALAALASEKLAHQETRREWLKANGPGGWIDDLRKELAETMRELEEVKRGLLR